ncbi:hypothetical protein E8E13_009482 [Curvularia kusanoi]|uniref:VOC domain-containing protein n=1 Tax=Curvularia kusanoi TaxID=90978 RepID=A0A9P4TFB2_CURKU|nr:hypothetical protein E8E13_009482 [Curvularia kusanoi]
MSLNGHVTLSRTNTATNAEKELRSQMPPVQTASLERNSTTISRPPTATRTSTTDLMSNHGSLTSPATSTRYQRFVMTDIVASRYLEEDPQTTVLAQRQKIEGYEIYLVEQWACSRTHPTFMITTYTGNPSDTVLATVISVPADESQWSKPMQLYFKSLNEYHAKRRETPYGTLMITNLNGFPSSLTVIPVPGGDLRKYRETFFVNEDLKRLGCSGRLGIKLEPPSGATEAKFHQLYRTSEKIPLNGAVIELVKLCQVALVLFGKLEPEYADGLLCDVTEKAVNNWWVEFGAEYYTVEPHDGILGPTTVAALLGMLMGARNRLSALNAPVAKDVFDIESTKKGIAHFQKTHHLPKTRRLDRQTLDKLRRVTAKAASKEGWGVPRAFKSTVAELGGKGGEMVMGIVGAGEKDGIAEVETVDIERFVELVRGDHAKWLWHGRPRKTGSTDMFDRLPDEEGRMSPTSAQDRSRNPLKRQPTFDDQKLFRRETGKEDNKKEILSPDGTDAKERDPFSKRAAIKAKLDPERGFHRIKGAVGLRSHSSKLSRDEHVRLQEQGSRNGLNAHQADLDGVYEDSNELFTITSPQRVTTDLEPAFTKVITETPHDSTNNLSLNRASAAVDGEPESTSGRPAVAESEASTQPPTAEPSIAGSIYHGVELNEVLPYEEVQALPALLRRTQSADQLELYATQHSDDWWPRHLSFSIAEESVLTWRSAVTFESDEEAIDDADTSVVALGRQQVAYAMQSEQLKRLHHRIAALSATDTMWAKLRLGEVKELDSAAEEDIETLESIYHPRLDNYHSLRENTHAAITNNRAQLNTSLRELDTINDKLEYEISALRGKVEDVEDFVDEFEKQVEYQPSRETSPNRGSSVPQSEAIPKPCVPQRSWQTSQNISRSAQIKLTKLVHMRYQHPDLDEITVFLRDFGMSVAHKTESARWYKGYGDDQYVYYAQQGPKKFLGGCFEVESYGELEKAAALSSAAGGIEELVDAPGGGYLLTLQDPEGFPISLIYGQTKKTPGPYPEILTTNYESEKPRVARFQRFTPGPAAVHKLGHYGLCVQNFGKQMQWYTRTFNLVPTDILYVPDPEAGDGSGRKEVAIFAHIDRGADYVDHHTFFMSANKTAHVHHSSFEVHDFDTQSLGHEWLAKKGYKSVWGVGRHILGSQLFDYWWDTTGNMIEHYADGDLVNEETPVGWGEAGDESLAVWGPEVPKWFLD